MSGESCFCDYDSPTIYNAVRPIARKSYECSECGRRINRGERYERANGRWDYGFDTFKTCVYCLSARDRMESAYKCFCWSHGGLREDIANHLDCEAAVPGIRFAVGRVEVYRRRDL